MAGTIPQEIVRLWNLKLLAFHFNQINGFLPQTLFNISKLEIIKLFNNQLSGSLPSDFGLTQPSLRKIYLGTNHLTGALPHSISNATKLVFFDVSGNEFTGTVPRSFGNLRLIEFLGFGTNKLINDKSSSELSVITTLTNCRNLNTLILDRNPLNGFLPSTVGNFSSALERLFLSESGIKGTFVEEIGNLTSLQVLLLNGNELTGKIPASIKHLKRLEAFLLHDNQIKGLIAEDICHLQKLVYLSFAGNQFSGPVPACIGNVGSLRYLDLSSNRFNSSLPISLGNLKDLLNFSVSTNSFSGHIPYALGNMKVAIHIDLSQNQFSGNIPSDFGNLQNLVNLSLAHNRLQGPIPDTFKHAVSLEYIDLSSNHLSSMIPKSLETLMYLKYFNVSFNSFSGEIPSDGPFRNFTSQSFLANEALCGASRFDVVACSDSSNHGSKKRLRMLLFVGVPLMIASLLFVLVFTSILIIRNKRSNVQLEAYDMVSIARPGRISYHELQKATDGFSESNILGRGSFGSVYKGVLQNGTVVAVKVLNLEVEGGLKSFDVECEVLRRIRHRNLGHVISSCSSLDFKALVLEYMPNGSLEKWLYSHNLFLDLLQRIDIMIDVGCALEYLHCGYSSPVIHCDLKPSNVLLDNNMVAHLTDFGITKLLGEGESAAQTITLATYGYMAPGEECSGYIRTRTANNMLNFLSDLL